MSSPPTTLVGLTDCNRREVSIVDSVIVWNSEVDVFYSPFDGFGIVLFGMIGQQGVDFSSGITIVE
jgi:hypothetical protein